MRFVIFAMYIAMAVWMLVAAVLRVLFSLTSGIPIDPLPAVTGGLGLFALLATVPELRRQIRSRGRTPTGQMIEVPREGGPRQPRP